MSPQIWRRITKKENLTKTETILVLIQIFLIIILIVVTLFQIKATSDIYEIERFLVLEAKKSLIQENIDVAENLHNEMITNKDLINLLASLDEAYIVNGTETTFARLETRRIEKAVDFLGFSDTLIGQQVEVHLILVNVIKELMELVHTDSSLIQSDLTNQHYRDLRTEHLRGTKNNANAILSGNLNSRRLSYDDFLKEIEEYIKEQESELEEINEKIDIRFEQL